MSCHDVQSWTLPELVGAFVDLAVAHLLLLAAFTTFMASFLLSLFGLRLPCSCPYAPHFCLRNLLSRGPRLRLSSAHTALAPADNGGSLKIGFCEGGRRRIGLGVEESCGSLKNDLLLIKGGLERDRDGDRDRSSSSSSSEEEWLGSERLRRRGRKMRKGKGLACGDVTHRPLLAWQEGSDVSLQRDRWEGSCSPVSVGADRMLLRGKVELSGSSSVHLVEQITSDDELGTEDGEDIIINKGISEDPNRSSEETIWILEKALEEEQAARAALYLELKKERNASATAADEAMAMIERLQNEKASIDMDAKQYQRMIEEKSTFDEEEMELLKEIILKRERELFVLGKEVEAYRQFVASGGMDKPEEFDGLLEEMNFPGERFNTIKEWPMSFVPQSTNMNGKVRNDYGTTWSTSIDPAAIECKNSTLSHDKSSFRQSSSDRSLVSSNQAVGKLVHPQSINVCADDEHLDFQEKGIVSVDVHVSPEGSQDPKVNTLGSCNVDIDQDRDCQPVLFANTRESYRKSGSCSQHVGSFEKNAAEEGSRTGDAYISSVDTELNTFDVHVIDDKCDITIGENVKDDTFVDGLSGNSEDHNVSCRNGTSEDLTNQSETDVSRKTLIAKPTSPMDTRRNSTSAVEVECSKLETEVEDLRRRLRIVQLDRQKLNFSVDSLEKENFHLDLLDEIAAQLREIKQLAEPERVICHASVPLPSTMVDKKKKEGKKRTSWSP